MAEPILEQDAASPSDVDEVATAYLDKIEQRIALSETVAAGLLYARDMLDAVDEAVTLGRSRDRLLLSEEAEGRLARRVDRLRDRLAKVALGAPPSTGSLSVQELADAIGQSDFTTRRLLDLGRMPGARRKTPGVKNSPWIIPATAPTAYLASPNGKES